MIFYYVYLFTVLFNKWWNGFYGYAKNTSFLPNCERTVVVVDSGSFFIPNLCFQMHLLNNCLLDVFWIAVAKILFTKKITFFNTLSLVATSSLILSYDNALRY